MFDSIKGGLDAIGDTQLEQNRAHMAFNSALSDPKAVGDLFIALALHD
jgi:hypothetical protein